MRQRRARIGCVGGQAKRINERVIDGEWIGCLAECADVVGIPPLAFMKLFGGSIERWKSRLPASLDLLAEQLKSLCAKYRIEAIYVNLPVILPYLMMARNARGLNLSFVCIAHSVGSEFWLRHWIGVAPLLTERDVLLVSSSSSRRALLNLSPAYERSKLIPLCTRLRETDGESLVSRTEPASEPVTLNLLSIGRIESVKNIHVLLRCFAAIRKRVPNVRLYVAGELTGPSEAAVSSYRALLERLLDELDVRRDVIFTGPVTGEDKERLFAEAALLLNVSTDLGETFGFNLLEAKARGLPVVCTNWDGFRDLVADGEEGYLTACGWEGDEPDIDEAAFVQACVKLLSDEALRRRFSRRTLQLAADYDYRIIMPRVVDSLEQAMGRPARSHPIDDCMNAPITSQPNVYRLSNMAELPFLHDTPLEVHSAEPLGWRDWPRRVKPIIHHYGGSVLHAEL